jgi:phage virion morphogenesis protein
MPGLSIRVESVAVESMLSDLVVKMTDLTPVMREIGEILVEQTDSAFESGRSPGGKDWEPSKRAQATGGQTLIDTAILRNSITAQASADEVEVGTNVVYAAIHQLGGKTGRAAKTVLPARPFLPDQESIDWIEIKEALRGYLA